MCIYNNKNISHMYTVLYRVGVFGLEDTLITKLIIVLFEFSLGRLFSLT